MKPLILKKEIFWSAGTRHQSDVLFQDAKAIITDTGGMLSHSAIIAREYRIPAVLGTKVGTDRLKDGDRVIVDGNTGTVTIIDG